MVPIPQLDLWAPWQDATLLQVRTSKMKQMRGLSIFTGIYKEPRNSRIFCSYTGVDKAIHQYFPGHYKDWKSDHPEAADAFEIGSFGENLVASGGMNERNVCVGDIIRVGGDNGVLLQVSLPRQPCFKLNSRFGLKGFAAQTWKKSRTGWYYRVIEEGWMEVGDEITLVERKYSDWTIERVQEVSLILVLIC
jgi:MOSC domain-containing protein YiiM